MNESLNRLPRSKQDDLNLITELHSVFKEVEMVFLFGSYARYKMDEYSVTQDELKMLAVYVTALKSKTAEICKKKIREIGEG